MAVLLVGRRSGKVAGPAQRIERLTDTGDAYVRAVQFLLHDDLIVFVAGLFDGDAGLSRVAGVVAGTKLTAGQMGNVSIVFAAKGFVSDDDISEFTEFVEVVRLATPVVKCRTNIHCSTGL